MNNTKNEIRYRAPNRGSAQIAPTREEQRVTWQKRRDTSPVSQKTIP